MGSVCPSCYRERWKESWTRTPDDTPRLCDKHLMIEHPKDPCVTCGDPHEKHTWGPSWNDSRVQALVCPRIKALIPATEKPRRKSSLREKELRLFRELENTVRYSHGAAPFTVPHRDEESVLNSLSRLRKKVTDGGET